MRMQNELTTGRRLNAPSDDPGDSAIAQQVRKTIEKRSAYADNLNQSKLQLSEVDSTLGDVSDLLLQAQQLASANVGDNITQQERENAATVVRSIYSQLVTLGNKSFEGSYIFAGDKMDHPPFEENASGVTFVGSSNELQNEVDEAGTARLQVDGSAVWGALSTRIEGSTTLTPSLTGNTRLTDMAGGNGVGVRLGAIRVSDGTTTKVVDLNGVDTIQDVITAINNAAVGTVTASINAAGDGLELTGGAGDDITVTEIAGGNTAGDLGIRADVSSGTGLPVIGGALSPRITTLTPLAALNGGAGIDTAGLTITNGASSATIDLSTATTVEDMLNAINGSNTGVRAEIKPDGSGIRLLNPTQGSEMRVAENGGTTAADLGLRSFDPTAKLADLNAGKGVRTVDGVDFQIQDANGVAFDVDLGAATGSVQDVIDAINTAATTAGAGVTASFATAGNGITLTDTSGGAGTLTLTPQNFSQAATDLGIDQPAAGNVIAGKDVHQVVAQGVFANVGKLRDAMLSGDQKAITEAAESLQADYDRVVRIRGDVGAQVQDVEQRQGRLDDQNVATTALLSELEDTDFTEAISKFSLLQTSLQASLQAAGQTQNLSLMDFLR
jgi:flagellin-like hook-associated protein FlgL